MGADDFSGKGLSELQMSMQSTFAETEDAADSGEDWGSAGWDSRGPFVDEKSERARKIRLAAMDERRSGAAGRENDRRKRLLRKKVGGLLDEVLRRQKLRDRQRHQRRTAEQRWASGKGPQSTLAEVTSLSLGLGDGIGSPRRANLMRFLTTDELLLIRDDTNFYLDDGREERGAGILGFFSPQKSEVDDFVNYRLRLQREIEEDRGRSQTSLPWVKEEVSSRASQTWHSGDPPPDYSTDDRMPSLTGKAPQRDDTKSPILARVREVVERRNDINERFVEKRLAEVQRRAVVNAFKVKQQQRELQAKILERKELGKVLAAETKARKDDMDVLAQQHADQKAAQKLQQLKEAEQTRAMRKAEVQQRVAGELQRCQQVTDAFEETQWLEDEARRRAARQYRSSEDLRLREWATHRHDGLIKVLTHETLRGRIQQSLKMQKEKELAAANQERMRAFEDRFSGAQQRREALQSGNRKYDFVSKAFGAAALKPDPRLEFFVSRGSEAVRRTL